MPQYIDGFVHPVRRDRLSAYLRLSQKVAEIWMEYGALHYQEYVADDMHLEGTRSFSDVIPVTEEEVILFGWVKFESRQMRDLANKKVAADPRMTDLVEASNSGFDASRMVYGGFRSFGLHSPEN